MEITVPLREIKVRIRDSSRLESYLRSYGFKDYTLDYIDGKNVVLVFEHGEDALAFVLKGIVEKMTDYSVWYSPEAEFDFMIRLEKKLKSYSKCDEFVIRKVMKDT
jgi:hypothetical protein